MLPGEMEPPAGGQVIGRIVVVPTDQDIDQRGAFVCGVPECLCPARVAGHGRNIPFRVGPRHHTARDRPFLCRMVRETNHGGALRTTANCASLRSPAARRSSNSASPPHGTAFRAIAIRGRLRATPRPNHPPLQLHCSHPKTAMADRRSSNVASSLRELICAFVQLRMDRCLLQTPWTWQPRQPSFPATHPCPETSADCAP